jgi:chemotaxis protein CheC
MAISKYEDINSFGLDVLKEIGSIGTGNAATALSKVLSKKVKMTLPEVKIVGFNKAIYELGGPETIVAGVLVHLSGEIKGMMLYMQELNSINTVLECLLGKKIDNFMELNEIETSALIEVGNIIISSYVSAISSLTGITISLSVPEVSVNMLGGIMNVPIAEYGYQTDKLLMIGGNFSCEGQDLYSNLILMPEIESLNFLMEKLGVSCE